MGGTPQNPIVIRGASQAGVILDGNGCVGCNVIEVYGGGFVHIERLTIRNAERAIRFQTSGAQENVVRGVLIQNTQSGLAAAIINSISTSRITFCAVGATGQQLWRDDGGAHGNNDRMSSGFRSCGRA